MDRSALLKNKILVVGCGRFGASIASQYSLKGKNVMVIDNQESSFDKLSENFQGYKFIGDCTDISVLKNANIETVVGPMTGGILLAHETGKALGTRAIFTERENGHMTFKRGFTLKKGERVLIVEDIVTTGGSVKEVIEVVRAAGGVPVAIGMLVDRSGGKVDFGDVPYHALLHLDVTTYDPKSCPLCQDGVPMTKRGRTGK